MKAVWTVLAVVVALGLVVVAYAGIPREEMGSLAPENCLASITTQKGSADTYFRTYVCADLSSTEKDCGYYEMQNGTCVARYDYTTAI